MRAASLSAPENLTLATPNSPDLETVVMRTADTFLAVCRTRSFHEAARQLGVTQSAVSQKISNLENSLSVELFDRTTRPLTVTSEAKLLKDSLESSRKKLGEAILSIQADSSKLPDIDFGMIESFTTTMGADLIESLKGKAHRTIFRQGPSDMLVRMLRRRDTEAVVVLDNFQRMDEFVCEPIMEEPMIAVLPAAFAKTGPWTLQRLSRCGLPLLASPRDTGIGIHIAAAMDSAGVVLPEQYGIDNKQVVLDLVERGFGWCLTYPLGLLGHRRKWEKFCIQVVQEPGTARTIAGLARRDDPSPALKLIADGCRRLLVPKLADLGELAPDLKGRVRIWPPSSQD